MSTRVAPLSRGELNRSTVGGLVGLGVAVGLVLPRVCRSLGGSLGGSSDKASGVWDRVRVGLAALLLRVGLGDRVLGATGLLGGGEKVAAEARCAWVETPSSPSGGPSSPPRAPSGGGGRGDGGGDGGEAVVCSGYVSSAKHVAIIMDGNRRFGKAKHGDSLRGHWDGGQTLVDCVKW
jgi:hypothetical protein